MKELILARSFISAGKGHPHASYLVSTLAVALGTAFLILTLGVYDSYVDKLEAITWSVYPHLLVFDSRGDSPKSSGDEQLGLNSSARCQQICDGETVWGHESLSEPGQGRLPEETRLADLQDVLEDIEPAAHTSPLILDEADFLLRFDRGRETAIEMRNLRILGIELNGPRLIPEIDLFVEPELLEHLRKDHRSSVLVSSELALDLWGTAVPSDQILEIVRPEGDPQRFHVLGTFSLGFHSISRNMLITQLDTAQSMLGLKGRVSYFGVHLDDPYGSGELLDRIRRPLRDQSFTGSDWTSIAGGDFSNIQLFRWILFTVLGLSFVITGLSIRNTLTIITVERRQQIGTLKALGLRDGPIRQIFLWIALSIGMLGAIPGLVLGSWLSFSFGRWLDQELVNILPIRGVEIGLQPEAAVQVLALVALSCIVTALLSVGRALALDPVSCLTSE